MRGRGLAHGLDWRLIGKEVAAVNRVVKVLPGGIAFAFKVLGGVDAALRANRVRSLDRDNGKQIDVTAGFSNLDSRRQAGQAAANHDDFRGRCHKPF